MSVTLQSARVLCGNTLLIESPTCFMFRSRPNSTWNGNARQNVQELILGSTLQTKHAHNYLLFNFDLQICRQD